MPAKNDFVRAGRYDIARAVERWGGLYEVWRSVLWLIYCVRNACRASFDLLVQRHFLWTLACVLLQLADELGYAVSDSRRPGSSEWQAHISEVAATTGLSGREVGAVPWVSRQMTTDMSAVATR